MATTLTPQAAKAVAKIFGQNIETDLALEFLRVVERAAIAESFMDGRVEAVEDTQLELVGALKEVLQVRE